MKKKMARKLTVSQKKMADTNNSRKEINNQIDELRIERKKIRDKRDSYEMQKNREIADLYDALETVKSPEERAIYQLVIERFKERKKFVCDDFEEKEYLMKKQELDLERMSNECEKETEQKGEAKER